MALPRSAPAYALAFAALLALPQTRKPGTAKVTVTPFPGTYEEACVRAYDRNVPLLCFAFVENEGEAPHEDIIKLREEIFAQPEFVAASPWVVLGLAANRAHEQVTVEVEVAGVKSKVTQCSVYRTEGCSVHQKLFDAVYREYNVEGELRSPAAILIGPDRKVVQIWQNGETPPWAEVLGAIKTTRAKLGEGLTEAQLAEVRGLIDFGTAEMGREHWGAGYAAWGKVLAITTKTRYAEQARKEQARAETVLAEARAKARVAVDEGRPVEGYVELVRLAKTWAGTPREKELQAEIASLEKDKRAKTAITAYLREQEAEALWTEARSLETAREAKKAEAKLRVLLRKFADTPAGKRAREQYPALAADEDARREKPAGGGNP
jgi:hypothetical protein